MTSSLHILTSLTEHGLHQNSTKKFLITLKDNLAFGGHISSSPQSLKSFIILSSLIST